MVNKRSNIFDKNHQLRQHFIILLEISYFQDALNLTSLSCFVFDILLSTAAPVTEWLRSLTSVLLIIRSSHRCGFAPRTGHEFTCETSHVLLAGVPGGFSQGTPLFAPPTD